MSTVNNNNDKILISGEENHINKHEPYLETELSVPDNAVEIKANDANVRLVNYGVRILFSSISLETISGKTVEYIDHSHPNLLI